MTDLRWQKATFSDKEGTCVELAAGEAGVTHVRDSKNPAGPVLTFNRSEMAAFVAGAKDGEFDHLI